MLVRVKPLSEVGLKVNLLALYYSRAKGGLIYIAVPLIDFEEDVTYKLADTDLDC
jgi:hypothetical protein